MSGTDIFRAFEMNFYFERICYEKKIALMLSVIMLFSLLRPAAAEKRLKATKQSCGMSGVRAKHTIDPGLNSAVDGATMLAHLFSRPCKVEPGQGR